jgi:hypothetical protein
MPVADRALAVAMPVAQWTDRVLAVAMPVADRVLADAMPVAQWTDRALAVALRGGR